MGLAKLDNPKKKFLKWHSKRQTYIKKIKEN
jgi:hypothetical protein